MSIGLLPIDEVVHFDEITVDPTETGSPAADADSTPTFSVFEEATDTPIVSVANFTKRTSLTGNYRGTFTCSAANGFEAGKCYSVISSATVGGVAGKKVSMRFRIAPVESAAGVPKVDASHLAGTSQTGRDLGASVLLSPGTGTGQIALTSRAVLLQPTQSGVTIPTVTTLTNAPSDTSGITTLLSRLSSARAGYLDNLSAGAVATAAKLLSYFQSALRKDVTVDADIGGNYDDATDSQEAIRDNQQSAAAAALTAYDPPTRTEATSDKDEVLAAVATVDGVADAIKQTTDKLDDTLEDDAGTYRFTEHALEEAPTGGSAPTAGEIADAVWDEDLTGHSTPDSAGDTLGSVATGTPPSAAAVADEVQTRLLLLHADYDAAKTAASQTSVNDLPTNAELATALASADDAVLAAVATRASQASVDDLPTNAELASALTPVATAAELAKVPKSDGAVTWNATAAAQLQQEAADALNAYDGPTKAELDAADDAVLLQVALVKAKTDLIPSDPADASDVAASFASVASTLNTIAGYLDTEIAAIKAKTDGLPSDPADQSALEAAITAAVAALATAASLTSVAANVTAVKAQTDKLTFNGANRIEADVKEVNDVTLQGAGVLGNQWRPA
jgi:hypothetical protein